MKKLMKRIGAVLMAVAMMAALGVSAWAADGDHLSTPESTITATNVIAGDSVYYYQLVEWDATNSDWKLTELGTTAGVTLDNLIDGISETEAALIATNLASASETGTMTGEGTTFTVTNVAAGLYYLKAVPATDNKETVYNPAFVSADYTEGKNTVDFSSSYTNSAVVKKSDNTFDKSVNSTTDDFVDVKPGDVIPYKITTKIPSYGSAFTNPTFTVTDTLSTGLKFKAPISVKYGDRTATGTNEDVTITTTDSGFTVNFAENYLKTARAETAVEITYSADVTTDAKTNVTYMDNKAQLVYSNKPGETSTKDDITRHYTFTIDGNLLGQQDENSKTSELIKTGVKADGSPITEESERTEYSGTKVSPLAGATFLLKGVTDPSVSISKQSTADGRINFEGLRAGEYELTETQAPAGYVKDSNTYTVTITPVYEEGTDILKSYTVKFAKKGTDDEVTASFTISNDATTSETTSSTLNDKTQFIQNKQGSELPSTGGIGTYVFTVAGVAIMAIAAGLLIVRHKKKAE